MTLKTKCKLQLLAKKLLLEAQKDQNRAMQTGSLKEANVCHGRINGLLYAVDEIMKLIDSGEVES